MGNEQRRSPRNSLVVRVDYPDDPGTIDWTENISASGIFIRSERALAAGQTFRLVLTFPKRESPLPLSATVVWLRTNGVRGLGVRIDSPQQRKHLADSLLEETAGQGSAGPYRVFIVEDNPHLAKMLRLSLTRMAAVKNGAVELSFFVNGHEAVLAAVQSFPDLVVTNVYMPVMDGLALIRKLRIHPMGERLGILAMGTNKADEEQLALKAGADGFLPKPFDIGEMTSLVADLLLAGRAEGNAEPPEIIIIDDEQDNVDLLARALLGHRVLTFTHPEKALEAALAVKPTVLVVDYKMPGLDGVTLVERLRHGGEGRCSVIMVTAFPDLDEVVYARQHQLFYRLVPKPVDPAFLRDQVETAIEEYARKSDSLRRFLELSNE